MLSAPSEHRTITVNLHVSSLQVFGKFRNITMAVQIILRVNEAVL